MTILTWHGKEDAVKKARKTPYRLLREVAEFSHSHQSANANKLTSSIKENLIIQGDNLEALKSLLPFYAGQVKCIFIDPPYNTKKAFEHYDDNLEHSLWLSLMYPRLELLRELLSEDGSIWVTLDDNESHYFKIMMDEIFGRSNFIGSLIWKTRKGGGNDSKFFAVDHNYVLSYFKNKNWHIQNKTRWRVSQSEKYLERYKEIDENGLRYYWDTLARDGLQNPIPIQITAPDGTILNINSQKSLDTVIAGMKDGTVKISKGKKGWSVHHRVYMPTQGQVLRSILDVGTNGDATDELRVLFPIEKEFDYPKPENLIQKIFELCTKKGDLVLDSFLGSGTTAAVAHKMNRRYIGIEIGEHAKTHVIPRLQQVIKGEQGGISTSKEVFALENDDLQELELDIDEIKTFHKILKIIGEETELINKETLNRLQNATKTKKIKSESVWQGGGSFRFCELGETIFDEFGAINPAIKFEDLAAHIWYAENYFPLPVLKNNSEKSPFIGTHNGKAFYLLFNGILKDKRPNGGNVLTSLMLKELPQLDEFVQAGFEIVVYGEGCRLAPKKLAEYNITFKLIPHDVSSK